MPHKNADMIKLKLIELRREELPLSAQHLVDQIVDLMDERPRLILIPREDKPREPA
jgi:hypothetical protein